MPEPQVTLTPVPGATLRHDDDGNPIVDVVTCGVCGRSWNDAAVSDRTPVPSGRCPFEYDHEYPDEKRDTGLRVVTLRALVRADDADEVKLGLIQMATHDSSLSAYAYVGELNDEDTIAFADVIDDLD